jgi:hypothetical protein
LKNAPSFFIPSRVPTRGIPPQAKAFIAAYPLNAMTQINSTRYSMNKPTLKRLAVCALLLSSFSTAFAQVGSMTYGNQRYYSNGVTAQQYGNQTQYSNGVTAQTYGNQTQYSNGVTAQTYGNQTQYSNGVTAQTYGNQTHYSNGVTCQRFGNMETCN